MGRTSIRGRSGLQQQEMGRQRKRQSGCMTAINMAPGPRIRAPTRSACMTSLISPVGGPFSSAMRVHSPPVASRRGTILCPVWISFLKHLGYALTFCYVASQRHAVPGWGFSAIPWMCAHLCTHDLLHRIVLCPVGGPFGTAWRMCSSIVLSYDTMLYACLPRLKALPASSSPAWLKEPQPRNSRHWGIQWGWAPRLRERGTEAVISVSKRVLDAANVAQEHSRTCSWAP